MKLTDLLGRPIRNGRDGTTGTVLDSVKVNTVDVTVYRTEAGNLLTVETVDAEEVRAERES